MSHNEYADLDHQRRGEQAMVRAVGQLKHLQPPCWRYSHHGPANRVVTIDGRPHAVCAACAYTLQLDRNVARQREVREAMRRGR
jgi:hypothetical protein